MKALSLPVRIALVVGLPFCLAAITLIFLLNVLVWPVNKSDQTQISVEISTGMNFKEIAQILKEKKVVRSARGLGLLAKLQRSPTDKISAGEYIMSPSMQPREILAKLVSGDVLKRVVVFKEGTTFSEMADAIHDQGLATRDEIMSLFGDPGTLAKLGIPASNLEGYPYPDTYYFSKPITAREIVWHMVEEGERHWSEEDTLRADQLGMSRHEILTLASIIEKESGKKIEDQPLISSVFHNRLKAGMRLQADPTVIYGVPNFDGNLTKEHLQTPSPYNTYLNLGLPPGPICSPSLSATKAALNPVVTTYLFFVADGLGGHVFSTTLAEHNEAVRRYITGGIVPTPQNGDNPTKAPGLAPNL